MYWLFIVAFALVRAEHAGYLLIGFIVTVAANVVATVFLSRQLDNSARR